jgi:hypothetical protein
MLVLLWMWIARRIYACTIATLQDQTKDVDQINVYGEFCLLGFNAL